MAFEYGFYNSINSDRKYNAIQFGQIFDGVINDGVFLSIGEKFATLAAGGMDITVGTGKAWFNHTWSLNTTKIPFTLDGSHPVLSRYDAIILEINDSPDVYGRVNSIKVVKGEPSSNAVKPSLVNDQYIHQYPLSYVKINPGATDLTAADIEIMVGRDPCPYVTGILQTTDITELYNNWEGQFDTWFNNLKAQLTDNVVANLQNQIDGCLKPTDIATIEDINNGTAGKLVDASGLKNNAKLAMLEIGDIVSVQYGIYNDPRFIQCNGCMYRTAWYPDWWAKVRPTFNKISRTSGFDYRTAPANSSRYFIANMHTNFEYLCSVRALDAARLIYNIYDLYNFYTTDFTINFRTNLGVNRRIFNIIRESSIKGDNNNNIYILLHTNISNNFYVTVLEIKNNDISNINAVTEFTRSLTIDGVGSVNLNQTNSYVVLENDTFHVYCITELNGSGSSGPLYYFSFYLDRVNKEVRLVTKWTQIPVIDKDGSAINIIKMYCPGIIADSGNIYFGALSGDKKKLLMLKITNKTACSVVDSVAPTDPSVVYNASFYRVMPNDWLCIHAIGKGTLSGDNSYPASTGYIGVNKGDEQIWKNVENRTWVNDDTPISKMFYNLSNGGTNMTIGFLSGGATTIYYDNYIWIVDATLFYNGSGGLASPYAYFYANFATFNPNIMGGHSLILKMYDYGYISPDYYMLLYPINNNSQHIYYPELSAPNIVHGSFSSGYIDYIKIKP